MVTGALRCSPPTPTFIFNLNKKKNKRKVNYYLMAEKVDGYEGGGLEWSLLMAYREKLLPYCSDPKTEDH